MTPAVGGLTGEQIVGVWVDAFEACPPLGPVSVSVPVPVPVVVADSAALRHGGGAGGSRALPTEV